LGSTARLLAPPSRARREERPNRRRRLQSGTIASRWWTSTRGSPPSRVSCAASTTHRIFSPRAASLVIDGARQFHVDRTPSSFYRLVAPLKVDFVICLTQGMIAFTGPRGRVTPNYLAMASPVNDRVMFVSHALLKDYSRQAEVSFEVAIANLVTGQLVAYFLDIDYHGETRDCPMDFDDNLDDLVCALRAGRFCSHCATRLARNPQLSKAVNALIRWDR
jgi:hypothetical protein